MALTAILFDPAERRGADRRPVARDSTLRADPRGVPHDVTVHDLSCEGLSLETGMILSNGAEISIGLPGIGTRAAIIARRDGQLYGCRFVDPVSPDLLRRAFIETPVVAGAFPARLPLSIANVEPHVRKWHPAVRVAVMMGLATTLWTAILHLRPF